jgi:ABC-type antimicrobial peptide transport system permease subunit
MKFVSNVSIQSWIISVVFYHIDQGLENFMFAIVLAVVQHFSWEIFYDIDQARKSFTFVIL